MDASDDDDSRFVEMDQTGRYGRYAEVLGRGAFKTVYRAFDEVQGIEVAWNQLKIEDLLKTREELEHIYSEVHLLKTLKHKNIIKLYCAWVDIRNKNINFITEFFTSGTLRQYIRKHQHVDIKAVKNWARQILRGLLYLHSHDPPIIHRDLKCDNIFINGNTGQVKIGDLGLATILRHEQAAHSVIGTPEFMAPELYEEDYNELVDIYSFGMCILEMVTFEYPYSECANAAQIYKKVSSGKQPAALDRVKDPDVRQFIEKCLAAASKRLPARELLMDPFLHTDFVDQLEDPLISIPRANMIGDDMDELMFKSSTSTHSGTGQTPNLTQSHLHHATQFQHSASFLPNGNDSRRLEDSDSIAKDVAAGSAYEDMDLGACSPSSSFSKEDESRMSKDFKVQGKKNDENTVSLRLRIADSQGHFRNIHFVFDIESDTAMSVASEMVAELDLSDQDVTTIAEMIDTEIMNLVPEWNPGASFDETTPETEDVETETVLNPSGQQKNEVDG